MFIFPLLPFFRTAGPKEEPKVGKHFSAIFCLFVCFEGGRHEFSLFFFLGLNCFKLPFCCNRDYLAWLLLHGEVKEECSAEGGLVCK